MKLVDLQPRWFDVPGVGTNKDGVTFLCPCAKCVANPDTRVRLGVQFANPIGSESLPLMSTKDKLRHVHDLRTFDVPPGYLWQRTGENFGNLTLVPSVDASASGHWHGHVTNGEVT
jgi:hypothetical protein